LNVRTDDGGARIVSSDSELLTAPTFAERCEALSRVSRAIRAHGEPKELIGVLVDELHAVVRVDFASVSLHDQESDSFRHYFIDVANRSEMVSRQSVASESYIVAGVYEQQEPWLGSTDNLEPRFEPVRTLLKEMGLHAVCSLPLTTAHRKLGAITFGSKQADTYSANEVRFMSQVADQIALAFDDASNFTALRRASEELQRKN
jgi:formate hydrogenlyase transcriptional activator